MKNIYLPPLKGVPIAPPLLEKYVCFLRVNPHPRYLCPGGGSGYACDAPACATRPPLRIVNIIASCPWCQQPPRPRTCIAHTHITHVSQKRRYRVAKNHVLLLIGTEPNVPTRYTSATYTLAHYIVY